MTEGDYAHAEAFAVMRYVSDDGTESEMVWNSRDGVTPFVISLKSGKAAQHVDWFGDSAQPDYQPPPGSRVFVDLTPERARAMARENCARWWDDGGVLGAQARVMYGSLDEFVESTLASYMERPGTPDLIEVPPEGWKP